MRDQVGPPTLQPASRSAGAAHCDGAAGLVDVVAPAIGDDVVRTSLHEIAQRRKTTWPEEIVVTDPGVVALVLGRLDPEVDGGRDATARVVDECGAVIGGQ